ncbi:MAG: family 78 glycoside hydrolase catalytic domain [Blautia sp.]|nr:family 78 glycoside hydrolase catalytic domain [Blautia sp.]
MKTKRVIAFLMASGLCLGNMAGPLPVSAEADATGPAVVNLKTQGRVNPLGVDTAAPAFSWQMQSSEIGAAQQSYQIKVNDAAGNEVWDSGVVESNASAEILYEGEALAPATAYSWTVTVEDNSGNTLTSEPAAFETSLLSDSIDAWDGAEWIGAGDFQVDAASTLVYRVSATVQLAEGSNKASFILGADDFRLKNKVFNLNQMEGENYVRAELDLSGVTASGGAKLHLYRVGYDESDSADTPFLTVEENEDLDSLITEKNKYDPIKFEVNVAASKINLFVNDTQIGTDVSINPLGGDSSYNSFPNLNSVGFAVNAGESAVFTDYQVRNTGKYGRGVYLDKETGATYAIFEGQDGVTIDDGAITVGGGESGVLFYADPTYAAAPMLRTEFETKADVDSARLYLTAQGIYDFYLNGQEVAPEEWFNPGATEYDQILTYNVYDVTEMLEEGANAMGAVLGQGWWAGNMTFEATNSDYYGEKPALLAKLVVTYADGSTDTFVTDDETWDYYGDGPVRLASLFQGEAYDATKEAAVEGWTNAGYDASAWTDSAVIETRKQFANYKVSTRYDEPVHVIRTNEVVEALGAAFDGTDAYIYDMGENVAGVPVITIPEEYAAPGETMIVRFAETLYPDMEEYASRGLAGTLMVENYRDAMVTDRYVMKEGENVFAPDLTWHGYRYIEISGLGQELPAECIRTRVLSSLDVTATYETSNELVNQLFTNITNSTTSNYLSIPTDCPQRNERMGWTGDAQVYALAATYVTDTYNFIRQWMDTVRADCGETGMSSQYCPAFVAYDLDADDVIPHNGQSFGITWNSLVVTIPYDSYIQTGKLDIVKENIENIYAYVDNLAAQPLKYKIETGDKLEEPRLTNDTGTLADHLSRISTDSVLLGEALYIKCLDQAIVMADAIGDTEKADEYRELAADAREAWNELYIDPETGKTKNTKGEIQDTQASYATPLRFHVISEENLEKALEHYNASIAEPSGEDTDGVAVVPYTLTTGFNATGNVLNALSDNGLNETAYKLFESADYASWLYPVTQGATSIWERWNSYTEERGFGGNNAMNSFNHYSFGAVFEWMMGYQLGIISDPEAPGYQHFILQPIAGGTFTEAKGSYESPYGTICSGWTAADGQMTGYTAVVPANSSATLYLPVSADKVTETEGVTCVGTEVHNGIETSVFELAAGSYHFDITDSVVTVTAA